LHLFPFIARLAVRTQRGAYAVCRGLTLSLGLTCGGAAWPDEPAPPAPAQAPARTAAALPTFAELEGAGATVGRITVVAFDIFDTDDPREDYLLFRWANALHIQTRPGIIERALLFRSGDALSARLIEETERLLRTYEYLYDVRIRPLAVRDGVVDIEVATRDTWSLDLGVRASRAGGANASGIGITEHNLLGTGTTLGFSRTNDVDRSSNEFQLANDRVFGTRTSARYSHAENSDGGSDDLAVVRPFYALDTRWAAGITASRFDRIDAIYNAGEVASEYRHEGSLAQVFGGWSAGLANGWVQRYTLGLSAKDDSYSDEPDRVAPAQLPTAQKLVGPFVGYQLIEDRFDRQLNRNLIGRPEFFALGLASTVQLGWASTALGSSQDAVLYAGSVSRGFEPGPEQTLMASARISGQLTGGRVQRQQLGGEVRYYRPQGKRWLFYASAAGDLLTNPDVNQTLLLGGDNGLRGYPLRYQSGTRRVQFTAEERFYTDTYLWRLFRIGGAAFVDTGRAWGGDNVNTANPGWLSDVGMGLRIVSDRSAFGNVIHVDIAIPLNATPDIQKVQFLVSTRATF